MSVLPFQMPSPFAFSKRVFAHYFPPFPLSIGNQPAATDYYQEQYLTIEGEGGIHDKYGGYLRARPLPVPVGPAATFFQANMQFEVAMAIARGITVFAFDITSITDALDPAGRLHAMLAAAQAVDPRFGVAPMFDMNASPPTQAQAVALLASLAQQPSAMRLADGRLVFAAFNATLQTLAFWQGIIGSLNAQGVNVAFLPVLLGSPTTSSLSPIALGVGGWGTATPAGESLPSSYLPPILPQQFRPKSQVFWEAQNFDAYADGWMSAITGNAPFAQVITWNDFSESGQVQPCTDASLALNIGTGFYDLTAYYATWFLSGQAPPITRDVLYWCHRRMSSTAAHPNQPLPFALAAGSPPETSSIGLLAFLTAPGTLLVNGQAIIAAPTGITSLKAPMAPGQPTFALQRNGSNVFSGVGPVTIYGPAGAPSGTLDLTYWSGSLSSSGLA